MSMTEEQDKALAKVRKLLQRAEDDTGSTQGEREQAMRMAHAILAKHNLSIAQAEASGTAATELRVDKAFEFRSLAWARTISNGVGDLFFCKFFYVRLHTGRDKHYFVGREANVITAMEIAEYVIKSVLSERDRRAKVEGAHDPNPWKLAFAQGAAAQIYRRCKEMRAESETKDVVTQEKVQGAGFAIAEQREPGTALVLASHYKKEVEANSEYIKDQLKLQFSKKKHTSRDNRGTDDAYTSGRSFGQNVSLNRQVAGPRKQLK